MQRRAQRREDGNLAMSLAQIGAAIECVERALCVGEQPQEQVIELEIGVELAVQIVEVHEDRHLPHLEVLVAEPEEGVHLGEHRAVLRPSLDDLAACRVVERSEEVRATEVAELQDVERVLAEAELPADGAGGRRMPEGVESRDAAHVQHHHQDCDPGSRARVASEIHDSSFSIACTRNTRERPAREQAPAYGKTRDRCEQITGAGTARSSFSRVCCCRFVTRLRF